MAKFLSDDLPPNEWQRRRDLQARTGDPNGGIDPSAPMWALHTNLPSEEWHRLRALQASGSPQVVAASSPEQSIYTKRDAARDLGAGRVLDRIGIGEQDGRLASYDATYGYGAFVPAGSKKLTEMTFDEVAALQKNMLRAQAGSKLPSSAVGMYQFLNDEAERLRKKLGLKGSDRFTAGVQDMMAREILDEKGYGDFLAGKIDGKTFQKALAPKWASIAAPGTGKSYYGQPIGTATDEMQAALAEAKAQAQRAIAERKADPYQQRWR